MIKFAYALPFLLILVCLAPAGIEAFAQQEQEQKQTVKSNDETKNQEKGKQEKQDPAKTDRQQSTDNKTTDKKDATGKADKNADTKSTATDQKDDRAGARKPEVEKDPRPRMVRSNSSKRDKSKAVELSFDDIKFEMEKNADFERSMLTEEINELDQQKVRLRGFIRPSVRQTDLTKFVFVRDNQECCFGPGAMLYDCVLVELDKGESTDFTVRPVTIEGTFYLKEFKGLNGKIWAIYRMKKGVVR